MLFLTQEELGPPLAYAPEDDEWQTVVAMRDLLRDLYSDTHRAPSYGPQRSRGRTPCIVAWPPANRTTSSTWRGCDIGGG